MRFDGKDLAIATGFIMNTARGPCLITNRHNVTGRHWETDKPLSYTCAVPNEVLILQNKNGLSKQNSIRLEWIEKVEKLFDKNGNPLWLEHPTLKNKADFVALHLTNLEDVAIHPYDSEQTDLNIVVGPSDIVSVIGFPFGLRAGSEALAVWATGFIASEPDVDYNNLPLMLIDCRSRQGQSGSPVIAHRSPGLISMERAGGGNHLEHSSKAMIRFLGIYSGRVKKDSDIGMVWKVSALKELIDFI